MYEILIYMKYTWNRIYTLNIYEYTLNIYEYTLNIYEYTLNNCTHKIYSVYSFYLK